MPFLEKLPKFLDALGLKEEPFGVFYTDEKPLNGYSPEPLDLPTREKEIKNEINWPEVFRGFACVMQKIWLARKRKLLPFFLPSSSDVRAVLSGSGLTNPRPKPLFTVFLRVFRIRRRVNFIVIPRTI